MSQMAEYPRQQSEPAEQINKSIRQMRQGFGCMGVLTGLGVLASLGAIVAIGARGGDFVLREGFWASIGEFLILFLIFSLCCACFWIAAVNLGKRNKIGYIFAMISSILLLSSVFFIFGIIYLIKLSKPEMKKTLGVVTREQDIAPPAGA